MLYKRLVGALFICAAFIIIITVRMNNPDATETRLFLDHWPKFFAAIALGILGAMLTKED